MFQALIFSTWELFYVYQDLWVSFLEVVLGNNTPMFTLFHEHSDAQTGL